MRMVPIILVMAGLLSGCSRKPASNPAQRLAWRNQNLVKAYDTVGRRNPKWDEAAHKAVSKYAQVRAEREGVDPGGPAIGVAAQDAILAGCDDPLVRYLYCRFGADYYARPLKFWQEENRKAAQGLEASGYSPLLKFYANDHAAIVFWQDYDKALWKDVVLFRRTAMADLNRALQDKSLPVEDVLDATELLIKTVSKNDTEFHDAYDQLMTPLYQNWPDSAVINMIQGRFNYEFAWRARGGGTADTVTEEGWRKFSEYLVIAEKAYRKAWELDPHEPRIATQMIEMAVSQKKDRMEMELWFQRAMELDTNNYAACQGKLRYLNPKWYGTREDMIAFGKECVASTKWGGEIPLALAEAHRQYAELLDKSDRAEYYRLPEVWEDVQASYEKYFQNPDAKTGIRYPYAYYAFRCGKWKDFTYQIKLIRDADGIIKTNYFGSAASFDKMIEIANARVTEN